MTKFTNMLNPVLCSDLVMRSIMLIFFITLGISLSFVFFGLHMVIHTVGREGEVVC